MEINHLPSVQGRSPKSVQPDMIHDFRDMPYADESFCHVVFDPPHVRNISMKSVTGFSYGSLDKETWQDDLRLGFAECFRVLKQNGTLIFKWNEVDIPLREILALTPENLCTGISLGKKLRRTGLPSKAMRLTKPQDDIFFSDSRFLERWSLADDLGRRFCLRTSFFVLP